MIGLRHGIPLFLLLAFASLSNAQISTSGNQLTCSVSSGPGPQLRSEGITERIADIVITCLGGTAVANGAAVPQVNNHRWPYHPGNQPDLRRWHF